MDETKVYVISGYTTLETPRGPKKGLPGADKLPTLKEIVSAVQEDLAAAGVNEWSATIETEIKVGTGAVIPGGSAGIKTTVTIKGKTA
jgi:hypothetical protein